MSRFLNRRVITIVMLGLIVCSGFGKAAGAGFTIEHWMMGTSGMYPVINAAIEDYQVKRPDIKVKMAPLANNNQSQDKILLAMLSGTQVDVIRTNPEVNLYGWAKMGLILPLDDLIKKIGFDLSDFYPEALNMARVDGKLYAIPYTVVPIAGLFYRTDFFANAGLAVPNSSWTWEGEFMIAARKLVQRDATGTIIRYAAGFDPEYLAGCFGASPLSADNTKPNALSQQNVAYMRFLQTATQMGFLNTNLRETAFINGQTTMDVGGYWYKETFNAGGIKDVYGVAPIPKGPNGRVVMWVIGAYSITKATANAEESLRYIAHLTSPTWSSAWVAANLNPSPRRSVNVQTKFLSDPVHRAWGEFYDYPAYNLYWPPNLRFLDVRGAWQRAYGNVMKNASIDVELQTLNEKLTGILAESALTYTPAAAAK